MKHQLAARMKGHITNLPTKKLHLDIRLRSFKVQIGIVHAVPERASESSQRVLDALLFLSLKSWPSKTYLDGSGAS